MRTVSARKILMTVLLPPLLAACTTNQDRVQRQAGALVGTWYIRFIVKDAVPGFNLPGIVTVHADGTFQAVDGGDFGAIPDLPFNQAAQLGVWQWLGENRYLQKGLMLSFSREDASEGQLVNILGSRIEIELDPDLNSFTAFVTEETWNCADSFSCPDPIHDPPDKSIAAQDFWIEGWRLM